MIWLISYPRSGNTFFRNVLFEVYGIKSSTFHVNQGRELDEKWEKFSVIKSHELPETIPEEMLSRPIVYIVRDGRDSIVSSAHHTIDLGKSEKTFDEVIEEVILARDGSYFGGWSKNVNDWVNRASVIIRFEDLIADPIGACEKLRPYLDMPKPDIEKLPTFKDLRSGLPKYGAGGNKKATEELKRKRVQIAFRRGKVGGWRDDMTDRSLSLFWNHHGETMHRLGYSWEGDIIDPHRILEEDLYKKIKGEIPAKEYGANILIESSKLLDPGNDGVKRYQLEILRELKNASERQTSFNLLFGNRVFKLKHFDIFNASSEVQKAIEYEKSQLSFEEQIEHFMPYEKRLLRFKKGLKDVLPKIVYQSAASIYRALPIRKGLAQYRNQVFELNETSEVQNQHFEGELPEDINSKDYSQRYEKSDSTYDLIHIPLPQHAHWFRNWPIPKIVTVHDLTHNSHTSFHTEMNLMNCEYGFKYMNTNENVSCISISESTERDLLEHNPKIQGRSRIIYESASSEFTHIRDDEESARIRKKYSLPHVPYLLCLSTIEPRKNIPNTIKAFMKMITENPDLDCALFVCGKHGWMSEELIEEAKITSKKVILTGFIDEEDLPRLYNDARALCYLSYYEGFGLPPVESMRCGTPVLYGNNSSMPEVIQDGGIALDPDDIDSISNAMKSILSDHQLYKDLSLKALMRSNHFSWRKAAEEHLDYFLSKASKK